MPENPPTEDRSIEEATSDNQVPVVHERVLQVNAAALAPSPYAALHITDVLPAETYSRIGQMVLTPEQEALLDEPTPVEEIEIRPDGIIYVSHEYLRRKLNKAFGRMGWTLVPGSPLTRRPATDPVEYFQRWILFVGGVYCSEALASRTYFEKGGGGDDDRGSFMSIDDVAEAIKSDCVRRTAKDLGIGLECWNKRFQEEWKRANAIQVLVKTFRGNRRWWRRKDADPFKDRTGQEIEVRVDERPPPRAEVRAEAPPAPEPAPPQPLPPHEPVPAPKPVPAAPRRQVRPVSGGVMKLNAGQERMILVRMRDAKLLVEQNGVEGMQFLHQQFGIELIADDDKPSVDNLMAMIRFLPQSRVAECVQELDAIVRKGQMDV